MKTQEKAILGSFLVFFCPFYYSKEFSEKSTSVTFLFLDFYQCKTFEKNYKTNSKKN